MEGIDSSMPVLEYKMANRHTLQRRTLHFKHCERKVLLLKMLSTEGTVKSESITKSGMFYISGS